MSIVSVRAQLKSVAFNCTLLRVVHSVVQRVGANKVKLSGWVCGTVVPFFAWDNAFEVMLSSSKFESFF